MGGWFSLWATLFKGEEEDFLGVSAISIEWWTKDIELTLLCGCRSKKSAPAKTNVFVVVLLLRDDELERVWP